MEQSYEETMFTDTDSEIKVVGLPRKTTITLVWVGDFRPEGVFKRLDKHRKIQESRDLTVGIIYPYHIERIIMIDFSIRDENILLQAQCERKILHFSIH